MPIDAETLSQLALNYASTMTSIRGRRIVRLLKREFAGAGKVVVLNDAPGPHTVLGISESGAAIWSTNGKGPTASIIKWLHGDPQAFEIKYDLLKDSLPVISSSSVAAPNLDLNPYRR